LRWHYQLTGFGCTLARANNTEGRTLELTDHGGPARLSKTSTPLHLDGQAGGQTVCLCIADT
jgi:hypothetical protein